MTIANRSDDEGYINGRVTSIQICVTGATEKDVAQMSCKWLRAFSGHNARQSSVNESLRRRCPFAAREHASNAAIQLLRRRRVRARGEIFVER
jgi:hypothetical protein